MSKEGQRLNLKAGRVVAPEDDGRLGVVIQGLGENVEHFDRSEFTRKTQYKTCACYQRSVGRQFAQALEVT